MGLSGIHLTNRGDPVCAGEIILSRAGKSVVLRAHTLLCLYKDQRATKSGLALQDWHVDAAKDTGFYPSFGTRFNSDIELIFPAVIAQFINERLTSERRSAEQTISITNDASAGDGDLHDGYVFYHASDVTGLQFKRIDFKIRPTAKGLAFAMRAELISTGMWAKDGKEHDNKYRGMPYQLDAQFVINHETLALRYDHYLPSGGNRSGLLRAYSGDEVQTNLDSMNLTHPLVYNNGGVFALSREGTQSVSIDQTGMRIQPTTLSGWGWGSVYSSDRAPGRSELQLPWLTKDLLETTLPQMGHWDQKRWLAALHRNDGNMGRFVEEIHDQHTINERLIENIKVQFGIDRFGLTVQVDAKLSAITAQRRDGKTEPLQGPDYKKTLLLPWEVLILRDFDLSFYLDQAFE